MLTQASRPEHVHVHYHIYTTVYRSHSCATAVLYLVHPDAHNGSYCTVLVIYAKPVRT